MEQVNPDDSPKDSKEWVKEFVRCPACCSEQRMFELMGQEMKERGLFPPDMKSYYDIRSGPFANQNVIAKLPIGSKVPAFAVATDICLNCGCIYAVRLERTNATKGLAPVQFQPNRAQRRAGNNGGQGFRLPHLNNPLLS